MPLKIKFLGAIKIEIIRKANAISKLIAALSHSLLGRENLKSLGNQIYIIQRGIVGLIKKHRTVKVLHLFRNYSALFVVVSSALLVSATNLAAGRQSSGFLFGYFGTEESYENPLKDKMYVKANIKTNLALAPLAEAKTTPDPEAKNDDEESLIMQGQALVSGSCPIRKDPEEDGGVIIYEVRPGDTVGAIASSHNITINTILWANEMDDVNQIMPGDKIFILPVSGLAYTVKKGDDLDSLVKKYKAEKEKIIAFNDLPADGEIKEGQELLIPGGEKELPAPQNVTTPSTPLGIAQRPYGTFNPNGKLVGGGSGGHKFPYGYCTWYVASKKFIPWGGNAGTWLYHAKASGYATGKVPRPGAIMVSSESWWGHVAIVESVSGGSFTISEMNYKGWAKKSTRTIATGSRVVKGFIYSK